MEHSGIPEHGSGNFQFPFQLTGKNSSLGKVNRKNFAFHFIQKLPRIPHYGTNFQIIPFPKWKFYSGIMETATQSAEKDKYS